jgi:hypothetical protein
VLSHEVCTWKVSSAALTELHIDQLCYITGFQFLKAMPPSNKDIIGSPSYEISVSVGMFTEKEVECILCIVM